MSSWRPSWLARSGDKQFRPAVSASATLAWRRLDLEGGRLEVEGLRQVYLRAPDSAGEDRRARRVERVDLPCGAAVKVVSKATAPVLTLTKVRMVAVTQYLVPVPYDGWLAMITATTGVPELEDGVEAVADSMAASLSFQPEASTAPG